MEEKKQKSIKQILETILTAVLVVSTILIAIGSIAQRKAGNPMLMVAGWGAANIQTGSMEPTMPVGSLILIHKQDTYQVGDVVTYDGGYSRPITHRVIAIAGDEITTKGDANNAADKPFDESQIIGKVVFHVAGVGAVMASLQNPIVTCGILVIISLIWLLPYKKTRKVEDENDREESRCS